jgi:hypothetical protein
MQLNGKNVHSRSFRECRFPVQMPDKPEIPGLSVLPSLNSSSASSLVMNSARLRR